MVVAVVVLWWFFRNRPREPCHFKNDDELLALVDMFPPCIRPRLFFVKRFVSTE